MSDLRLRTLTACDKSIVFARGEITMNTSPNLEACLADLIAQGEQRLVVNLSHTPYVDSSGLAALVRAHRNLRVAGGQLSVIRCSPSVSRVLHIVGFHHLFPVEDRIPPRLRDLRTEAAA